MTEILQKVGPAWWRKTHGLIKIIWHKEEITADLKMGLYAQCLKKGDGNKCDSDIGTTLLSCIYIVLSIIVSNKLTE
jgi:hypothetical protein